MEPSDSSAAESQAPPEASLAASASKDPDRLRRRYVRFFYAHTALTLLTALAANLLAVSTQRPPLGDWNGIAMGVLAVSFLFAILVVPLVNLVCLFHLPRIWRRTLLYLVFDLMIWYFQFGALLPQFS